MPIKEKLKFPNGFLWGAAGSAYQTEGQNSNSDWWEWEYSMQRTESLIYKGLDPKYFQSGIACDFYNRYEEDFALAEHLDHNSIRIGVEWSRIEPNEGDMREEVLDHYEKMLQSAKAHNLKVFLTLHHYSNPIWFSKKGGFTKKENVAHFFKFSQRTVTRLSEYVDFWVTINEPELYAAQGFYLGVHPPQIKSIHVAWKVINNLIYAHNTISQFIRLNTGKPVSMAFNQTDLQPAGFLGGLAANLIDYFLNEYILKRVIKYCDYIGVNYYFHHHIGIFGVRKHSHSQHSRTDRGWGIHPEGIERVLLNLKKYDKPIYIIENGLADKKDIKRENFIKDHLFYIHRAIKQGADVRGYLYWSLTDNFEWEEGFWPRFGLIEIIRDDMLRRKVRYSALEYAKICRSNSMEYITDNSDLQR